MNLKPSKVQWLFKPRDLWIGVFWKRDIEYILLTDREYSVFSVYITFIPMFPILIEWADERQPVEEDIEFMFRKAVSE